MRKPLAISFGTALIGLAGPVVAQSTMQDEKKMATKEMGMKEMRPGTVPSAIPGEPARKAKP